MSTAVKSSVLARAQRGGGNAQGPGPIDRFLDAVWMERGLSPNTLAAYRADLTALERWLDSSTVRSHGRQARRPAVVHGVARAGRGPASLDSPAAVQFPSFLPPPRA
jgi:site-specific recombinase XerC